MPRPSRPMTCKIHTKCLEATAIKIDQMCIKHLNVTPK